MGVADFPELLEKRKYVRVRPDLQVDCRFLDAEEDAQAGVYDLSRGGVRFSTRREVAVGQKLELNFSGGPHGLDLSLVGTVVWSYWSVRHHRYEVGVQFIELNPAEQESVVALVGSAAKRRGQKRRFIRLRTAFPVRMHGPKGAGPEEVTGSVCDLSLDGMAVEATETFPVGAECVADLRLPGADRPASAKVRVLRTSSGTSGWQCMHVQFEAFLGDAREQIGRFLRESLKSSTGDVL